MFLFASSKTNFARLQFSDDEEDTKRVVRSAREKRFEDLHNTIKQMRNYKKIKDLSSMLSSKFNAQFKILIFWLFNYFEVVRHRF